MLTQPRRLETSRAKNEMSMTCAFLKVKKKLFDGFNNILKHFNRSKQFIGTSRCLILIGDQFTNQINIPILFGVISNSTDIYNYCHLSNNQKNQ